MKIKKIGHCCLRIEEQGKVVLTDPGEFSTGQNEETGIDAILITHEHADHLHLESLKKVLENNPEAKIITNSAVGKILDNENIKYEVVEDGGSTKIGELLIEGFGTEHKEVYLPNIPIVANTGYFIGNKLFYPGDALHNPGKKVDVLAAPVVGPWLNIKEAIDYIKQIAPRIAFPVHDGFLKFGGPFHFVPSKVLENTGIEFVVFEEGKVYEV